MFDNGRETSRVLEIDPARGEIVWDYSPGNFFSKIRGGSQKLPNGNVLVTDSQNGRAVEVTQAGEVVWEYFTTDLDTDGTSRGALYRMTRLPIERLARRFPSVEN